TRSGVAVLGWLAAQAARDDVTRMGRTRLGGEAAMHGHEVRLKERLHALLDSSSITDYLGAEDAKRKPRSWLSLGLAEELEMGMVLVPTLRRHLPLPVDAETQCIVIGDEPHRLSAVERRVLDVVLTSNGLAFGDLVAFLGVDFAESALREAVTRLAKQGLVGVQPMGAIG